MSNKKASGYANQIIIYSKGWYGRGKSIIEDLAEVFKVYSDIEHFSERDVWQILTATFEEFVPLHSRQEGLFEMLGKKWMGFHERFNRKPEEVMIGLLGATIKGEDFDIKEQVDFSLDGECHNFCEKHISPKVRCLCECSCKICQSNKNSH